MDGSGKCLRISILLSAYTAHAQELLVINALSPQQITTCILSLDIIQC